MKRRGQAALEFLTTYGWAFLVILVMIGALAYFGVLDPTRFIPQRCQFGQEMFCERFALQDSTNAAAATDRATFELRNNLPDTIWINEISWASDQNPTAYVAGGCANLQTIDGTDVSGAGEESLNRNNDALFICGDAAMALTLEEKQRVHLRIEYSTGGTTFSGTYAQYIYGEVFANVN